MKRRLQAVLIAAALRLVHAALVELQELDPAVAEELRRLPVGISYAIYAGYCGPSLLVRWDGERLSRISDTSHPVKNTLRFKALAIAFRLFTGQIGLAHAYAQHAFTLSGDIADVMRLARLVNRAEVHLFPSIVTRCILPEQPGPAVSPLRIYARIFYGFLKSAY